MRNVLQTRTVCTLGERLPLGRIRCKFPAPAGSGEFLPSLAEINSPVEWFRRNPGSREPPSRRTARQSDPAAHSRNSVCCFPPPPWRASQISLRIPDKLCPQSVCLVAPPSRDGGSIAPCGGEFPRFCCPNRLGSTADKRSAFCRWRLAHKKGKRPDMPQRTFPLRLLQRNAGRC